MTTPTLDTERLTLRGHVAADFPAMRNMLATKRARFMGGPYDAELAWSWFCSDIAQWEIYGHGGLAIVVTETGDVAGQISIINPPRWPQEELGWLLYDGFEGKGYATEAAAALRDWYYAEHPAPVELVSYVDPNNARSISVAKRMGGVLDPNAPTTDPEDLVFRHPKRAA